MSVASAPASKSAAEQQLAIDRHLATSGVDSVTAVLNAMAEFDENFANNDNQHPAPQPVINFDDVAVREVGSQFDNPR